LKDEILLDVSDLNQVLLNSLLPGIVLDAPLLGIQIMSLSLEKRLLEP